MATKLFEVLFRSLNPWTKLYFQGIHNTWIIYNCVTKTHHYTLHPRFQIKNGETWIKADFLSAEITRRQFFSIEIWRQNHGCDYHLTDFFWKNMVASSFCHDTKSALRAIQTISSFLKSDSFFWLDNDLTVILNAYFLRLKIPIS